MISYGIIFPNFPKKIVANNQNNMTIAVKKYDFFGHRYHLFSVGLNFRGTFGSMIRTSIMSDQMALSSNKCIKFQCVIIHIFRMKNSEGGMVK